VGRKKGKRGKKIGQKWGRKGKSRPEIGFVASQEKPYRGKPESRARFALFAPILPQLVFI